MVINLKGWCLLLLLILWLYVQQILCIMMTFSPVEAMLDAVIIGSAENVVGNIMALSSIQTDVYRFH